jgi:fructose-1,6-bisphosphatase/sedoheptulose 1,7-bisphosphatase-like protein
MNLKAIAKAKKCDVADLTVVILDRPRHEELIREPRGCDS